VSDSGPPFVGASLQAQKVDEREQARLAALIEAKPIEAFAASELEILSEDSRGRLFAFVPDGTLWKGTDRYALETISREDLRVVYEGSPPTPRFLRRNLDPATRVEWEARRAEREAAIERSRQATEEERQKKRKTATPVTAADFNPAMPSTLRGAVTAVEAAGGAVRIESGRVVVLLPDSARQPAAFGGGEGVALAAARCCYLGEEALLTTRRGNGDVSASKVPDEPVLPSGRLMP
jgi:hypothetical protein